MPRNRSMYPTASARIGKNTGPGRLRITARNIARTRMNTSAIRNSFTFTRNARAMLGNDSLNCSPLKNASLTSSQPGALMIDDRRAR